MAFRLQEPFVLVKYQIAYNRRSMRSTSAARNKEGDDAAKKIAEADAVKNKMEETRN